MMMNRRHPKQPFSSQFERSDLQNHRSRLHHEDSADDDQSQRLMNHESDRSDQTSQRERSGISHKNIRRMRVKLEKRQTGPDQRAADDRQLARPRNVADKQIIG